MVVSLPLKNLAPLPIPFHSHARCLRRPSFPNQFPFPTIRYIAPPPNNSTLVRANSVNDSGSSNLSPAKDEEEERFQVISAVRSKYNEIVIVDTPKSRMLLLDSTRNVHSIIKKDQKWTDSYWDEFASLPAIVPHGGPFAILGLGAGTAAHLMLHLWPSLKIDGWEIDEILIHKARDYFGLSDLEKENGSGGVVRVHIGDALSPENGSGGYAGIVVDLFCDGKVLPEMEEVDTWLKWKEMLMPNGRIMVNCGGSDGGSGMEDGDGRGNLAIGALSQAFGGQCCWKRMGVEKGANYLALTGPLPDLASWSACLPPPLSSNVLQWRPCGFETLS